MTTASAVGESTDSSYANVDQAADSETPDQPLTGKVWNTRNGYCLSPDNDVEDSNPAKIWHHDSGTYKYMIGDDLWDDESGQASEAG